MSTCMSKKIQGQSLSIEEENTVVVQKQGIVTIFASNHDAPTSLRRTLSADMSSKTWLSQNGFFPMKKNASSEELSHSSLTKSTVSDYSSSLSDEDYSEKMKQNRFQIRNTIQKEHHEDNKPRHVDVWSSILAQKANEETSKLTTTPYVHPLVRKSKSCLSEKSLEICTESLGSETGSDGVSSYSPSETEDSEGEKKNVEEEEAEESVQITHEEDFQVPKCNYAEKKPLPRSFPPPLPSLHMRSHRDNGRLFLQAVSVPSQNNFCAQRENGCLVLTFADVEVAEEEEEEEEEFDEAEEVESVIEEAKTPMWLSSGIGLALMMNKPIGLLGADANVKSPKWSEKFNDVVNFKDVDVVQHSHPLPPRPRQQHAIHKKAFNAYEYYWRTKPTAKAAPASNTLITFHHNNNYSSLENNFKSCKDSWRSFLIWEPYCIAT
ncbi:hypothetical protein AAZX31_12G178800 [Glycine max]|uniref:FAF domain-containing protein n=1 Tax=Glycine max TaxID=3847 RepID=I1LU03_SOYBN|nr:protein FAF-like, chloroplastic [Glycine max]XP_025980503.1 protein FAF-like, chloroplastic [Glycine max]KAG4968639.1 hypothetical protein JHK87_034290 [Glycine soja]KAG4385946.1 hypothetical protein GLYMA_12G189300v4 [Glycine max]KAG4981104.1 hypothetical protein JHK85_035062 [Glycine max]KAG4986732.1 hypothetical protein JHK86_034423 [Glycine max]KAG5119934.1 hypothetical protein JHK82_034354 [Glycine max]|eukprot:XP_025980502.1 protein FAF-like, chloroplastic [Glycine max]